MELGLDRYFIKRTVAIPKKIDNENVFAYVEIAGKMWGKEASFTKLVTLGFKQFKNEVITNYLNSGGTKEQFPALLKKAIEKVTIRFGE